MFISKKNRLAVYSYLFKEGTICAKKNPYGGAHSTALPIPNLEVMKLMQSFTSKGLVRETFNWQWYYWYLTEEGITYLRQYLGIPEDIVPATLKQTASSAAIKRTSDNDKEKSAGPGGEFNPRFQRGEGNREGGYRRQQGFGRNN